MSQFLSNFNQNFYPAEAFVDPVNKLRVSNPENLIDTDFEYGLQGTKWETLQTVNNVPTVYSTSGDTPIDGVTSVSSEEGSRQIRVTTDIPHSLSLGDPLSVQGLDLYQAEGFFIVSGVPDATTFFYELDIPSDRTGRIDGSYTVITPAKFFEGSPLPISLENGARTDGETPSTLDVITDETHGFSAGTKVYLKNTVGPKRLQIDNPDAAQAPDGRPVVDTDPTIDITVPFDNTTTSARGGALESNIVAYDWESTYTLYLTASNIDNVNDYILWTNHGFRDNYCLLFNTPTKGDSDHGLTDGTVYYVKVINSNSIELYTDLALTQKQSLTLGDQEFGLSRLGLVYRTTFISNYDRYTDYATPIEPDIGQTAAVGNSGNGSYRFFVDVETPLGTSNPTNVIIDTVEFRGDFSSSTEYVTLTFDNGISFDIGRFNGSDTSQWRVDPNAQNIDISSLLEDVGGSTGFYANYNPTSQVNFTPFGMSNWWEIRFNVFSPVTTSNDLSGFDLTQSTYGLGGTRPDNVYAFQGRTDTSNFSNNIDSFSSSSSQDLVSRFGTMQPSLTNATMRGTPTGNGRFQINALNSQSGSLDLDGEVTTNEVGTNLNDDVYRTFTVNIPAGTTVVAIEGRGDLAGSDEHMDVRFPNDFVYQFNGGADTDQFIRENIPPQDMSAFISNGELDIELRLAPSVNFQPGNAPFEGSVRLILQTQPQQSEVFYVFAKDLSFDKNTFYLPSHGLEDGAPATLTIDTAAYGAGERFGIQSSNSSVDVDDQIVPATINVVSPSLFRLQIEDVVTTNNITKYPNTFNIFTTDINPFYNTIYIPNHKISGSALARYSIGADSTVIGGLTNNTDYNLVRATDSRITLTATVNENQTATTGTVGRTNNNTITEFVDFSTPLGFDPSSASILQVEFRGDFAGNSEYVLISFEDDSEYFIGQRNGQDSSVWQTEETFPVKNVSSLLVNNNGNLGVNVTFDPTSQVNFSVSGMTNWWEIRFTVSADSGTQILSATGSGTQIFDIANQTGAYDGVYTISEVPLKNEFILDSDFIIPIREYTSSEWTVDTENSLINLGDIDHNLITGEPLEYNANGNASIFPAGIETYYAIVVDKNTIAVAQSNLDALNNLRLDLTQPTGTHVLSTTNVIKGTAGAGTVSGASNQSQLVGNGTRFLTRFKRFDPIWIVVGGYARQFTVEQVTSDTLLQIQETLPGVASDAEYFYSAQIILRPDGYSLHLPFDGGVDITAGTSPNSKIVRQSRKYFRYQSGKGIQNSFAINFNPPKIIKTLITAVGTIATVETQEAHNFKVGDSVTIEDAEISTGVEGLPTENAFNGTFTITAVDGPFNFSYDMGIEPAQDRAGGFPTYTRTSWSDSFVRAGMFDDQNGFFYEFDGERLFAVRRSSTLQISGTVNTTTGSQVISGNQTSFTSQLRANENIVVRGQSYKVVEVSSDSRIVVQPAYRGVTARSVKITKTVDVRTPQEEWNIDVCDGTGPSGYNLNLSRIQMAYADYSWYGAGKIRYGFKDTNGKVHYVHEYVHNNILNESYFRSGNLPGRYEIENGPAATAAPTLFHFGTSIIMDGTFDNDKAYLLSASSRPFAFTNGGTSSLTTDSGSTFEVITFEGSRVFVYALPVSQAEAESAFVGQSIAVSGSNVLPQSTYITQVTLDGVNSKIYTSYPALSTEPGGSQYPDIANGSTIILGETEAVDLLERLPLISVRLAPSVDSSLTGRVGEREIINRMQLALREAGISVNRDVELFVILNALPSGLNFQDVPSPSLSQLIRHSPGETLIDGTVIYSVKASAGSTDIDLSELLELGNSILGGDSVFPAGPDLLTIAVQPQSTTGISVTQPFLASGKVSWSESQA